MWKWCCSFALIACALMSVAYEQHHAREEYQAKSQTDCVALSVTIEEKHACAKDAQSRKDYTPWWYVLVAWPEGITVWAIIGTGFVIAWQSNETRKAAENAGKQLVFQQETLRPRLKITEFINNVFNEAMAGEWVTVNMKISNSGGLPAYGVIADTWIEFIRGVPPYRFSSQAKYDRAKHTLNIHSGVPSGFFIPLHRKLTEEERRNIGGAMGAICFRVRLAYRAFGEEVHTDDAYFVRPDGMEAIGEYSSET